MRFLKNCESIPFVLINQPVEIFLADVKKELSHHYAESLSSINNMDELNIYINEVIKHFDRMEYLEIKLVIHFQQ